MALCGGMDGRGRREREREERSIGQPTVPVPSDHREPVQALTSPSAAIFNDSSTHLLQQLSRFITGGRYIIPITRGFPISLWEIG
ncbi:unnamed protein product [Pleuronectes platessa]|uniref:Uncharacterized protein n=1 Tax=Pleuronectes platessa TaxID=8262 RepID=A0A9N7Z9D5_PLEPL|nr:unnamed protein product [Pleuronectes platessa]